MKMSKLIETVAKELCIKENRTGFCSGDLSLLHEIYDECIKRGMKPLKNDHALNILQRIRNGMRTQYLFKVIVVPDNSFLRRLSIYELRNNEEV